MGWTFCTNSEFNSVHAITSKISPLHNSSGIEMLEAENFKLYCNQTLTGKNSKRWPYILRKVLTLFNTMKKQAPNFY